MLSATRGLSQGARWSPASCSHEARMGRAPRGMRLPCAQQPAAPDALVKPKQLDAVKRVTQAPKAPKQEDEQWLKVVNAETAGTTVEVQVKGLNKGGLIVAFGEMNGFLPYTQLATSTVQQGPATDLKYLVGKTLRVKVVSVDVEGGRRDFVVSEKKAQQGEAMRNMKLGAVMKAVVRSVEDYGAFVELVDLPGVTGLVHKSELSWDSFPTVDSIVQKGQVVKVLVIDLDVSKCRLGLSMRLTEPDPIKKTLETVQWGQSRSLPEEIQQLLERLKQQPGVEDVQVRRQAYEPKIASQGLVVYLTRDAPSADGFDVVARLGAVVQELFVVAKVTREEARALLARAIRPA